MHTLATGFRTGRSWRFWVLGLLLWTFPAAAVLAESQATPEQTSAEQEQGASPHSDDESADLDRIVVTSNLREQDVIDVPMSVGVVTQDEIDRKGIQDMKDLSRVIPGMVVEDLGGGFNRLFFRGIANGNSLTSLVGVYMDDIPVTSASIAQLDLRLVDLERVEVLRGPQGTLYGQGSAGGTIRFVTRQPELDAFSGRAALNLYDTRHGDTSQELTGSVNVPLVTDVLGIRFSGTYGNFGGWVDQPAAGRENINDRDLRDMNFRMLFQPTEQLSIRATAAYHRNDGDGIAVGADEDYNVAFDNGDPLAQQHFDDDYNIYNLSASYDFDYFTLLASSSRVTQDKSVAGLSQKLGGPVETFISDAYDNESTSHELRLTSRNSGRFNWVVGAFQNDSEVDRNLIVQVYVAGDLVNTVPITPRNLSKSWSVYGDASYAVTDRLDIGAGVRYFRDRRKLPNAGPEFDNRFTSVDPRFYATYAVSENVRLYANIAKGFRSGGFTGDPESNTFDPEKVWSYELGTKGNLGHWSWELAGYYSRYKGYQAFVLTEDIFGFLRNAGDAEVKGIDWLQGFDPTDHWSFQLGGNINRSKLTKLNPRATSNEEGDRLDFVPDYSITASAEYRFAWGANLPGFVRVDYSQVGPASLTERTLNIIEAKTDTVRLLGARIGIERGAWSAQLFGQNLLGDNSQDSPQGVIGLTSRPRPRTVGVRFGVMF